MKPPSVKTWTLTQANRSDELFVALKLQFKLEADTATQSTIICLDDFDAHLWRAGYLLYRYDKNSLQLIDNTGKAENINAVNDVKFWWNLPESPARNTVKNLIGLRALTPVASLEMSEQHIALRNDDQKLVVRASLRSVVINEQINHYFAITELRGYSKEFVTATNIIAQFANTETSTFDLKYLLNEQTIPAFTQAKINLPQLAEDMPTERAVRAMAMVMLQQASIHVPGVIADTDTEFLHQFRVSFRKLRSLISLLQKSLASETVALLKPRLSAISGATNKLRDLDVFLLEQKKYRAMLPANFSEGLSELYDLIEQQRAQEKTNLAQYFSSAAYDQDLAICTNELSAPTALQTPMSAKPLLPVIKKLLFTRYHKMAVMASVIHSETLDEEVHELRIEFKKLRYLIEFFSSLLPPKRISKFIGEMKKIQAVLGNFNDYSIQIEFLNAYVDDSRIDMSKALSGLIAILHQKKISERNQVDAALANFFTPGMNNEIEFLFGATASGASK